MIKLINIRDINILKAALLKDAIYQGIYGVDFWDDNLIDIKAMYFLGVDKQDKPVGVLEIMLETKSSLSFHGGVYKTHRGKGHKIIEDCLKQMNKYYPDYVFWTKVRGSNKISMKAMEKMGCKVFGELPKADGNESLYFYKWR